MLQAEILSIGDELLIGQVINTNAAFISEQLNSIGIHVSRVTTIGDNDEAIRSAIASAWNTNDIVIATGGLGPTHDDISKASAAAYFGKKMHLDKKVLAFVKARFKRLGYKKMPDANIGQAMVPDDFIVLQNDHGTAPGLLYHHKQKTFIILAGVPHEMKHLMMKDVLPYLKKTYSKRTGSVIRHRTLLTTGIGESLLAETIGPIDKILEQGATLAFLPKTSGIRLRISVQTQHSSAADAIIKRVERRIRTKISEYIYGVEDETLEAVIVTLLQKRNKTISAAESCTGGMLGMRITNVPNASKVFYGGIISYTNDVKIKELGINASKLQRYGAVSQETVCSMAEGIRRKFDTDFGIAITGIAGPGGGTKVTPVGTVWIAVAEKTGTVARRLTLGNERQIIRERSVDAALEMLRRTLLEKDV